MVRSFHLTWIHVNGLFYALKLKRMDGRWHLESRSSIYLCHAMKIMGKRFGMPGGCRELDKNLTNIINALNFMSTVHLFSGFGDD